MKNGSNITCDGCGKVEPHDASMMLTGYDQEKKLVDLCPTCVSRLDINVCSGLCLDWKSVDELGPSGMCTDCRNQLLVQELREVFRG